MPSPNTSDNDAPADEEYGADFAASIANEIGDSLFPKAEKTTPVEPVEAAEAIVPAAAPAPIAAVPAPQGEIVPGTNSNLKPLPKSWKKDMAPLWEKADPALHEYVYAREADVMRGFQHYQQGYQQWDNLIKPFAPIFEQHPDVQPVALMQGLMKTHLQLLNPQMPAERKLEMARGILADYGINLGDVENLPAQVNDPRVSQLESQLQQLLTQQRQQQEASFNAGVSQQQQVVNAFASDPKNLYFDEVGNDIFRFIQTGAATDLQSAYDLACYANPVVRAKMLAAQQPQKPALPTPQRNGQGQFVNIEPTEKVKTRTRVGSIDDTIDAVVKSHYSNSH